jgi:hypothetical protein
MRTEREIQRAHDLIVSLLTGTKDLRLEGANLEKLNLMIAAADALCWVLGHDHNDSFRSNLQAIERLLAQEGIRIVEEIPVERVQ